MADNGKCDSSKDWIKDIMTRCKVFSSDPKVLEEIFDHKQKLEILKEIVNGRELEILKKLTEDREYFVSHVSVEQWIELINLSAELEYFEIYQELKKIEVNYEHENFMGKGPEKRRKRDGEIQYEYKNVLVDIAQFLESISKGMISGIESFVETYPELKLCYGLSDICALERAIDSRQFQIYAILRGNGFYSDQGVNLQDKIEALSVEEKNLIRSYNMIYTIPNPKNVISFILTKCKLDPHSNVLSFNKIKEMLEVLYEKEEIKLIMETLALSDAKIIFDFANTSTNQMDPLSTADHLGNTYLEEGTLYIAFRNLNEMYGTFAQEATHYVLHLIYENRALPYRVEDKEREEEWDRVVKSTREICLNDPNSEVKQLVKRVFDLYPEGYAQKAELIARVPDLLAHFHDNEEKAKEFRDTFVELHYFYKENVMTDLGKKNAYKNIKLNNEFLEDIFGKPSNFDRYKRLFYEYQKHKGSLLLSNDPKSTLSKLMQDISDQSESKVDLKVKNIFVNFDTLTSSSYNGKRLKAELEETLETSDLSRVVILFGDSQYERRILEENLSFLNKLKSETELIFIASSTLGSIRNELDQMFTINEPKMEVAENCQNSQQLNKAIACNA